MPGLDLAVATAAAVGTVAVIVVPIVQDQTGPRAQRQLLAQEIDLLAKLGPETPAGQALQDVITDRATSWAAITTGADRWARRALASLQFSAALFAAALAIEAWRLIGTNATDYFDKLTARLALGSVFFLVVAITLLVAAWLAGRADRRRVKKLSEPLPTPPPAADPASVSTLITLAAIAAAVILRNLRSPRE